VRVRPDWPDAHWSLSLALLARGDFEHGWPEYEWRWTPSRPGARKSTSRGSRTRWDGGDLANRTLYVPAEQGTAMPYSSSATRRSWRSAEHASFLNARELQRLLASAPGVAQVVVRGTPVPDFDCYCPLLSLPHALGTTLATIPAQPRYLGADPDLRRRANRIAATGSGSRWPRWAGARARERPQSLAPSRAARSARAHARHPSFSLQKGPARNSPSPLRRHEPRRLDGELRDFADTAR